MLLAAQLAQEPKFEQHSQQLFRTSRIQDFLDSIRESLIEYGAIRRSQTLLGSTVGSINTPYEWITKQATAYENLVKQLQEKRQEFNQKLKQSEKDHQDELQQKVREIFQTAFEQVSPFAEDHWTTNEQQMQSGWQDVLKKLKFENRLKTATESASQNFQHDVKEAIEEIGSELKIINQLQSSDFQFSEQDSGFLDKEFVQVMGMVIVAAGAILAYVFPPLRVVLAVVGEIPRWLAEQFKSREQKRHAAVENISTSLREQLEKQQEQLLQQSQGNFQKYCQSLTSAVDEYFEELIQGIEAIANQLKSTQDKLGQAANYLNRAYAKRIVDWATDQPESLTDIAITKKIRKVRRDFGRTFQIQATTILSLAKSQDEICRVLQETVSIQPTKR